MNIVDNIHQENNIIVSNEHILQKQFQQFNIQIYGTLENPFFKAKDIGDLLGIKKIRTTLDNLDDNCKVLRGCPYYGRPSGTIYNYNYNLYFSFLISFYRLFYDIFI
jgi:hypothetical protein